MLLLVVRIYVYNSKSLAPQTKILTTARYQKVSSQEKSKYRAKWDKEESARLEADPK